MTALRPLFAAVALTATLAACNTASPGSSFAGTWTGTEVYAAQNSTAAQSDSVRYVVSDSSGTLTGSVYNCADGSFNCAPFALTGTRSGSAVTLSYTQPVTGSSTQTVTVTTTGTLSGPSFTGASTYTDPSSNVFAGTTTLTLSQ